VLREINDLSYREIARSNPVLRWATVNVSACACAFHVADGMACQQKDKPI